MSERPPKLQRFDLTERVYHWVQGVPFLACLVTGAALLLLADGTHPEGRETAGSLHLAAGVALVAGVLVVGLAGNRRRLLENLRLSLSWRAADFRWLVLYPLHEMGFSVTPPPAGKFNAGQKLNLLSQALLIPVFTGTGAVMWLSPGVLAAWFAHVAAFVLAAPMVLGHTYLALAHRSTRKGLRGVIDGNVEREWAEEHYPLWVAEEDARSERETEEQAALEEVRRRHEPAPPPAPAHPGPAAEEDGAAAADGPEATPS